MESIERYQSIPQGGFTMQIHGLNKTTLLDYPEQLATTLFTGSCNFRCPFCHNSDLVLNPSSQPLISEEEVFDFLKKRKGILSGVCITGGEPTLQKDLHTFIEKIKDLGYLVKLDSNGYRPTILKQLLDDHLLDMIAMDIKSSPKDYAFASGLPTLDIRKIEESVDLIKSSDIVYEFRTTIVKELHDEQTFLDIRDWLKGSRSYALQCYKDSDSVIKQGYHAPSKKDLEHYLSIVQESIPTAILRGVD